MNIKERLAAMSSSSFLDFNAKLIPNISKEYMLGIKTPELRALARELIKSGEAEEFLRDVPHIYFEENQLHAFVLSEITDFDKALCEVKHFLPYIDNWATCDQLSVKAFAKHPDKLLPEALKWLSSEHVYTARFGIGILMRYFLDERFDTRYLDAVAEIKSEEYYLNMMSAWYFATALAKQWKDTVPYFETKRLTAWVHNKAIRKGIESYRISDEHKAILRKLTVKCK